MRFSSDPASPDSIEHEASTASHEPSVDSEEDKRNDDATEPAMAHSMLEAKSPDSTDSKTPEASPKPLKLKPQPKEKENNETQSMNTLDIAGSPHPEFVFPRELFETTSNEEGPCEPFFNDLAEQPSNDLVANLPASVISQFTPRLWSPCDLAMARRLYHELDDISLRIGTVMRGINGLMTENDDFDGLEDLCSCGASEASCNAYDTFEGYSPENHSDLLFMSSDTGAIADESSNLFGDE